MENIIPDTENTLSKHLSDEIKSITKDISNQVPIDRSALESLIIRLNADLSVSDSSRQLLQGHYRCHKCFTQWTRRNEFLEAETCEHCGQETIDPYYGSHADDDDCYTPIVALADHEKRYPSPNEAGHYSVEIQRTATGIREINVANAPGPASAQIAALEDAPNHDFGSGYDAEYRFAYCKHLQ